MAEDKLFMVVANGEEQGREIFMDYNEKTTLAHLYHFLKARFQNKEVKIHIVDDRPLSICSHSIVLIGDRLLKDVFPFSGTIPISITELGEITTVIVKGLGIENIYSVHSTDKVSLLKEYIIRDGQEHILYEELVISIAGYQEPLDENMTVSEAGVQNFCNLNINKRVKGGGKGLIGMIDVFNDKARRQGDFGAAPDWRTIEPGFSVYGVCGNKACKANGQEVVWNNGLGTFNLHTAQKQCPMCRHKIDASNLFFSNCFYSIRAISENNNVERCINWRRIGDFFEYWDPNVAKNKKWKFVRIIAKDLALGKTVRNNTEVKEAPIAENCVVCMERMHTAQNITMLKCCHSFHFNCLNRWRVNEVSKGTKRGCPECRR